MNWQIVSIGSWSARVVVESGVCGKASRVVGVCCDDVVSKRLQHCNAGCSNDPGVSSSLRSRNDGQQ